MLSVKIKGLGYFHLLWQLILISNNEGFHICYWFSIARKKKSNIIAVSLFFFFFFFFLFSFWKTKQSTNTRINSIQIHLFCLQSKVKVYILLLPGPLNLYHSMGFSRVHNDIFSRKEVWKFMQIVSSDVKTYFLWKKKKKIKIVCCSAEMFTQNPFKSAWVSCKNWRPWSNCP